MVGTIYSWLGTLHYPTSSAPSCGWCGPLSNMWWFHGPTWVSLTNSISISSTIFLHSSLVCPTQIDHAVMAKINYASPAWWDLHLLMTAVTWRHFTVLRPACIAIGRVCAQRACNAA